MTNPNDEEAPFIEITMLEYSAVIQYPSHDKVGFEGTVVETCIYQSSSASKYRIFIKPKRVTSGWIHL